MEGSVSEERHLRDWIEAYMEYTADTEPMPSYRKWVAISTLAAVLQRKCRVDWRFLEFFPNFYIVLVGVSGKCRKGLAMQPGREMLRTLGIEILPESLTRERLIQRMKSVSRTILETSVEGPVHSSLTVFSKELAVFITEANRQLVMDLTDLWDCAPTWDYETKHEGQFNIEGPWLNLIGATTPSLLADTLGRTALGGGLTSRMIFVHEFGRAKNNPFPYPTKRQLELKELLVEDLNLVHQMFGDFQITSEFLSFYSQWYELTSTNPPFIDDRLSPYCERRATHAVKLSMVFSASRSSEMLVTKDDLLAAIKLLEQTEKNMPFAYHGVGASDIAEIVDRILEQLMRDQTATFKDLLKRYYYDADKLVLRKALDTLEGMGKIERRYTKNDEHIDLVVEEREREREHDES